jgi:APA family basic amino acid/polyamine antiporter
VAGFFRRKSVVQAIGEVERGRYTLRRTLGAGHLTMLGVGAIVGAGIFSSVGQMAAGSEGYPGAGPALVLSYILTAVTCGFAALCYAEIAALVPVAGSAYTYAYVAFGEVIAWVIGWDLIIEYAIGNIYVAQSWADYFRSFLRDAFHLDFPAWMACDFQTAAGTPEIAAHAPHLGSLVIGFNLPAALIVGLLTVLLVLGIKESARTNAVMVAVKLVLVVGFVTVGAFFVKKSNWHPFAPNGVRGVWAGASQAFFSYIGFDAVSTAAEETRDPQRNLPRAMIASLIICTVLYVATALVMTGLVPARELGTQDPLSNALRLVGLQKLAAVMSFGAVIAVTAVLLVFQLGQPRIFMAMARDGLLPPAFGRVHPRFRTPAVGTIITGVFVAVMPSLITPAQALDLTNIGTLFAFILVSLGVMVLRVTAPALPRPFHCPGYPVTPVLAIISCSILIAGLQPWNWLRFVVWLAIGLVIYARYGRRHSRLEQQQR